MQSGIPSSMCQEREETLEVRIVSILIDHYNAGLQFNLIQLASCCCCEKSSSA